MVEAAHHHHSTEGDGTIDGTARAEPLVGASTRSTACDEASDERPSQGHATEQKKGPTL